MTSSSKPEVDDVSRCHLAQRSHRRQSLPGRLLASELGRLLLITGHAHRYGVVCSIQRKIHFTLPRIHVDPLRFRAFVVLRQVKGTLHSVEKNPYTEGLLCLLLHSEGTAIFYVD